MNVFFILLIIPFTILGHETPTNCLSYSSYGKTYIINENELSPNPNPFVYTRPLEIQAKGLIKTDVHIVTTPMANSIRVVVVGYGPTQDYASSIVSSYSKNNNGLQINIDWNPANTSSAGRVYPSSITALITCIFATFILFRRMNLGAFVSMTIMFGIFGGSVIVLSALTPDPICSMAQVNLFIPRNQTFSSNFTSWVLNGGKISCDNTIASNLCQKVLFRDIPLPAYPQPNLNPNRYYDVKPVGTMPGLYKVIDSSGVYNSLFAVTPTGVIVVDAPPNVGKYGNNGNSNIMLPIREITNLNVSHFIYSHPHIDHVGAAITSMASNYIAHRGAYEILRIANDSNRPLPSPENIIEGNGITLKLGNTTVSLIHSGDFHSFGDLIVYFPEYKTIMVVDLIFPLWAPFIRLGETSNVQGYFKAHRDLLPYNFTTLIPGHFFSGSKSDIEVSNNFLNALKKAAQNAIFKTGLNSAGENGNAWALYNGFFDETNDNCVKEFENNPDNKVFYEKLSGLDVVLWSFCDSITESLRIVDFELSGNFKS